MTMTRMIVAVIVVWILSIAFGTVIHAMLLQADYNQVAQLYRAAPNLPMIFAGYLAFAVGAVWLYSHGVQDRPWLGQGLRFGLAVWLIVSVTTFLIEYATQPVPEMLVAKQIGYELVNKLILGVAIAAIIRKA